MGTIGSPSNQSYLRGPGQPFEKQRPALRKQAGAGSERISSNRQKKARNGAQPSAPEGRGTGNRSPEPAEPVVPTNAAAFLREPELFETLRNVIFPRITANLAPGQPLRIWVVGCGSGEDVYSIAIALEEYLSDTSGPAKFQIFGTDFIYSNIQKARAGIYSEASLQGLSPERLRRFFTRVAGGYKIASPIREMCIFGQHACATDHPYPRIDLICCRNLSAQCKPDLQRKVLNFFHFALKTHGFLILDQAESVSVDRSWYPLADCKVPVYCKTKAEVDLRISQQELRQLTARLMTAAEEQRKEVARELHDAFGPRLNKLNVRVAELASLDSRQPQFTRKLREMGKEISDLVKAARNLSHSLHPAALSLLGLAAALEAECIGFSETHGIAVDFSATTVPASLPEGITFCLYRVAQEGLQNIRKHAQTKKAWVSVAGSHDGIFMVIKDIGRGFDVNAVRGAGGLGLVSMEERVRMVQGSMSIDSKPGEGTRIEARIPLAAA